MAKRFTDTGIYQKAWFRKLPPRIKCLWEWLRANCDHAGVIDFDPELASFQIGEDVNFDSLDYFEHRVERLSGNKVWLVEFVDYQYGELKKDYNPHRPVLNSLEKHGLISRVAQGFTKASPSLMDKDKDKDKAQDKDKDMDKDKEKETMSHSETGAIELFSSSQIAVDFLKTVKHSVQEKWLLLYRDAQWILTEIEKASTWCDSNASRSPKKNIARFMTNWLDRGWENYRKRPKTTTEHVKDLIANNPYRGNDEQGTDF